MPHDDAPKIIISSRDDHPAPPVAAAVRLAELATAHGWRVRLTYAVAQVPERHFDNGNLAKAAHRLESVMVRLRRGPAAGWASWHSEDGGVYHFARAFVGFQRLGLRAGVLPSIVERIMR